jgi:hypothetical protein
VCLCCSSFQQVHFSSQLHSRTTTQMRGQQQEQGSSVRRVCQAIIAVLNPKRCTTGLRSISPATKDAKENVCGAQPCVLVVWMN